MGAKKTRYAVVRWAVIAAGFGLAASYADHPTAAARTISGVHLFAMSEQQVAAQGAVPPPAQGEHGAGKKAGGQFRESGVYVDGKAVGILRYSEMPSSLAPFALPTEIDELGVARYYRLADYFQAIGVDVARVREMHIYGSHDRVAVITGDELRSIRNLIFDFTQQTAGKPRAKWAQLKALPHRPMVDVILAISLYVDKAPPVMDHGDLLLDGKPVEGIPYVDDGLPKGTRVYADGKLEGWVRRKTLPDKLIAPGSGRAHAKFSTDAFLAYVGADSHNAKAVEFYDGDTLLARVDGKAWQHAKGSYVFDLGNRSHGQVTQYFPGDKSSRITSIQLYVHTTPPARQPDPEALEQQEGGSDEPQNGGGNGDGSGGNNGVTPGSDSARDVNQGASEDEF